MGATSFKKGAKRKRFAGRIAGRQVELAASGYIYNYTPQAVCQLSCRCCLENFDLVEREETQDGVADDVARGEFAPLAGVVGAVGGAVVAHDEDIATLHDFIGVDEGSGVFSFV